MSGQRAEIYTNRYVSPENWNAAKGQSKGKSKKDQELNRYLDTIRTKICEIHNQLVMRLERSVYEVLQVVGISLTDKTNLRDLFDKLNFKNVNNLYGSSEPNLFDCLTL